MDEPIGALEAVRLPSRLDVATSAEVREQLYDALDRGDGDLVLDLADVVMVDAAGLGVLVGVRGRVVTAGHSVVLLNTPDRVQRLLGATRLGRLFVLG